MSLREILVEFYEGYHCGPKEDVYNRTISAIQALDKQRCKDCKEEKLNTVAEYFKRYNRSLEKPKIDEEKLKNIILNELKQYSELKELPSWANQDFIIVVTNNLILEIVGRAKEWLK